MNQAHSQTEICLVTLARNSRLFIIVLQYVSNIIIPDHAAQVFNYPKTETEYSFVDKIILHFLGGFLRWDGQYFMHIVLHGYTYENTLAFFPLYPLIVKQISLVIQWFVPFLCLESIALLVFVFFNVYIFLLSVKTLYKMTVFIFNPVTAYNTVIAFCFNPASVFFVAPYTECLFSFLTFQSIYQCLIIYKKYSQLKNINITDVTVLVWIGLSTLVRSNGVLNIGFFIYTCICLLRYHWPKKLLSKLYYSLTFLLLLVISSIICLLPFILYQIYCYQRFCADFNIYIPDNVRNQAIQYKFILPGQFSQHNQTWCHYKIPLAYSYVQSQYWNVGFLKYYEMKQIPNFLLASPLLLILLIGCFKHLSKNGDINICNLFTFNSLKNKIDFKSKLFNPVINVFVVHALFLSIFCILCIHIQVSTRMICSASPLFYWYCIHYFESKKINIVQLDWNNLTRMQLIIVLYFSTYFIIGTVMFCNFLPWT